MKTLNDLADMLEKKAHQIDEKVIKAQEKTAKQIYNTVIENAPRGTGNYIESIKIDPTIIENGIIKTFIGSGLMVGPTKWGSVDGSENNPAGTRYNLGYLLEHGTLEHAIPNAFNKGFYYGYVDEGGVFHKGTLDKNWHPGGTARPHYYFALIENKKNYKDNIKMAWRGK